jgi:hypothetical protein
VVLQKLANLSTAIFKERLAYTKHLAELLTMLKDEGVQMLGVILE